MPGAEATIDVVMPVRAVISAGTGPPGSTRVWNSPSTSPPRTFTAPNSVIAEPVGLPPVVSRSTTTNVTSDSGVPRSSSVGCIGALEDMSVTVGAGCDTDACQSRQVASGP